MGKDEKGFGAGADSGAAACAGGFERIYADAGKRVKIYRVSPTLYYRKADLAERGQCNTAFVVGDAGVAVVDAPPGAAELADEAMELFHKPVTAVYLTHAHGDHIDGLPDFLDREVAIYCSRRYAEALNADGKRCRADLVGIDGRLSLTLSGGVPVELFTAGDVMHSKYDMFVWLPDVGALCTGDSVVEYQTAYLHTADVTGWINGLQRLAQKPGGKWILPGHADVPLPYSYIGEFAEFLKVVRRAAARCFDAFEPDTPPDGNRFAGVGAEKLAALVDRFFDGGLSAAEGLADAARLTRLAGVQDARREVRMALWAMIREYLG
ncbi:MAG: MBL fold metallo-hydrolase [Clostridiales bacterium]|nr:MBL fold metallo-hydrolase [Clostridiales bacterium]